MIEARQVSALRHSGDGHGKLPPAQGLKRLDDRVHTPRCHLFVECLLQSLESLGVFGDRVHVFWEDELLGGGGTDHFREPSEVGGVPGSLACRADSVPQPKGFQTSLCRLEVTERICTRPAQIAKGFIFHHGDIDGGKVSRAHQPGQLHRIPTVGVHPVTRLVGHEGGGHDPAGVAVLRQIAVEPIAAWARFRDKDQMCGC